MPKRISWKKGMRLTDEVLRASDACTAEYISQALRMAGNGRLGLLPSSRPFKVQLSITKGFVDVEALDCLAITTGGNLIDAHFDTKFTNTFESRVQIPAVSDANEYILTINALPDNWHESADGYMEQDYTFSLLDAKSTLPDTAMPIARIINDNGWQEDAANFVPPCLCIAAHSKFEELHSKFLQILTSIDDTTRKTLKDTCVRTAISIYWPVVMQMMSTANTEHDAMTPQRLMACVQRVVGSFAMACELDELINLEDAAIFRNYSLSPYNYRIAYIRIKQGLGMCYSISEKVEKFSLLKPEPKIVPQPQVVPEPPKPVTPKPDPRRAWEGKKI